MNISVFIVTYFHVVRNSSQRFLMFSHLSNQDREGLGLCGRSGRETEEETSAF